MPASSGMEQHTDTSIEKYTDPAAWPASILPDLLWPAERPTRLLDWLSWMGLPDPAAVEALRRRVVAGDTDAARQLVAAAFLVTLWCSLGGR